MSESPEGEPRTAGGPAGVQRVYVESPVFTAEDAETFRFVDPDFDASQEEQGDEGVGEERGEGNEEDEKPAGLALMQLDQDGHLVPGKFLK